MKYVNPTGRACRFDGVSGGRGASVRPVSPTDSSEANAWVQGSLFAQDLGQPSRLSAGPVHAFAHQRWQMSGRDDSRHGRPPKARLVKKSLSALIIEQRIATLG